MQIPFGEWLPDQPEYNNPGANTANNVYFAASSYKRFPSLVNYSSNTMIKDSRGAGSFRDNSNTVFNFVANEETIYQLTGGAFTERGARGKLLSTAFATCTITVSDYASIGAGETITLKKNDGSTVVFTSTAGSPSTNEFQVQTDNDTTATNLKTTIDGHTDFSATVVGAIVTVTRATVGNNNLTNVSSDTVRLTTTNFYGGTPLTGSATDYITFTQFGNYIIASNGVDAAQYYLMGTSTAFTDLSTISTSGTVPTFKVSGVVRDFLVTGNHVGESNRIQWSGINDLATWESGTKQADLQDLPGSGGQITHITSGEISYVFRQNQIVRMDYVGGATVFRLSVISPNRGAVLGRTVCQDNRRVFFYADDGFYELNGDQVVSIGVEKVNRFFDLDLNKAYTDRICAAVDPFNQLAMWLYPSASNTSNTTNTSNATNHLHGRLREMFRNPRVARRNNENIPLTNIDNILDSFFDPISMAPTRQQIENGTRVVQYNEIEEPQNTTCSISLVQCQPESELIEILFCHHLYMKNELENWFIHNNRCPLCRYDIRNYNPRQTNH